MSLERFSDEFFSLHYLVVLYLPYEFYMSDESDALLMAISLENNQ